MPKSLPPEVEIFEALRRLPDEYWESAVILEVSQELSKVSDKEFLKILVAQPSGARRFVYVMVQHGALNLLQACGLSLSNLSFNTDDLLGKSVEILWRKREYEDRFIWTGIKFLPV